MGKQLLVIIFSSLLLVACMRVGDKKVSMGNEWREANVPYSENVVCTLKASATTVFENNAVSVKSAIDDKPTVLTFIDLDTESPSIIGNMGDRVALHRLDNGSTLYLIETTDLRNINIFTLFRDKNIMTMSKQYELFGTPFGLLMMGDCVAGS